MISNTDTLPPAGSLLRSLLQVGVEIELLLYRLVVRGCLLKWSQRPANMHTLSVRVDSMACVVWGPGPKNLERYQQLEEIHSYPRLLLKCNDPEIVYEN